MFEEIINDYKLSIHNKVGHMHTYNRKNMGSSNIDVTMTDAACNYRVTGWCVVDETDSDHRMIKFDYNVSGETRIKEKFKGRLNDQRADWPKFENTLRVLIQK